MTISIKALSIILTCGLISGCTVGLMPGKSFGKTPPQLIYQKKKSTEGELVKNLAWDHPEYFGQVPNAKVITGNKICRSIGAKKAIGYHPKARGTDGVSFKDGGYFCIK